MSSRDEILTRLRNQERDVTPPQPWQSRRHFDDPAQRFADSLTVSKGEVRLAADLEEALAQMADVLQEISAQKALIDANPLLETIDVTGRWPEMTWYIVGQSDGDLRTFAASADIGISFAGAALAETGTVVVSSGPGRSRLTSLLPPVHLALVPASCLTTDIFTWTAGRKREIPSAITLISGPSKTADIEQTLSTGVHGPKRFIAILYQD